MNRLESSFPECLFLLFGVSVTLAMLISGSSGPVLICSIACLTGYGVVVSLTAPCSVVRLLANYLTVWILYSGSGAIIDSLQLPDRSDTLLTWDRMIFGESPAVLWQSLTAPWVNEFLSAGYLSYHFYLHWILFHSIRLPTEERPKYSQPLFTAFAIGFSIYFLLPAPSISISFPELFHHPLEGYGITATVELMVSNLAASYDSFPSMHVFMTGVMLSCDFVYCRRRFRIMLIPSVLMVASTILLRLHYAIDLIASAAILVPFVWYFVGRRSR